MRRTALLVLAVGLLFPFFTIQAMGIDLLIDAVGFLVAFNALRALRRLDGRYRPAVYASLALVAICAAQLFVPAGAFALAAAALRYAGECVLYASLCVSLAVTARRLHKRPMAVLCACVMGMNLLVLLVQLALLPLANLLILPLQVAALAAHLLLLGLLLLCAILLKDEPRPGN